MSRPSSPYFVGLWTDWALMGGASIVAYAALRLAGPGHEAAVDALTLWSYTWVLNGLHFAATNYRLYRSTGAARQYPATAAAVPLVLLAAVWACLRWPQTLAPYFVKLFLFWSPYHYAGQAMGLSQLYARRSGFALEPLERRALGGVVYAAFLASVIRGELGLGTNRYIGVAFPALGLPAWSWTAALGALGVCAAGAAVLFWRRVLRGERVPGIVLLPAAAQVVWVVLGPGVPAFYPLVPMFHGLQYLLVAWFMQIQTAPEKRGLAGETLRWGAWNLAGYLLLFWLIPKTAAALSGQPILFAGTVAMAAVQIHHFFVDGVIWKLRDPRVSSPLMAELA